MPAIDFYVPLFYKQDSLQNSYKLLYEIPLLQGCSRLYIYVYYGSSDEGNCRHGINGSSWN